MAFFVVIGTFVGYIVGYFVGILTSQDLLV